MKKLKMKKEVSRARQIFSMNNINIVIIFIINNDNMSNDEMINCQVEARKDKEETINAFLDRLEGETLGRMLDYLSRLILSPQY